MKSNAILSLQGIIFSPFPFSQGIIFCFPENEKVNFFLLKKGGLFERGWPWFTVIETFRFYNDEYDNEYEIFLRFFAYSQNIDSPESFILPFFTTNISTLTFSEGGYTLFRSQNDKTSNISFW